ncbi:hypothetical protein ANCCAN_13121 [Ancylostoma caninum]|uniref:Uncharacterized protein n=1 Tax=Ancylostoma caninum TaxID=29170 RepID=A0A368G938_ANCCA|nr:hypothetical protein ANCCAN_13121 [Ancylostoma caninum]
MMTFPLCGLASSDHSHAIVELATRRDSLKEGRPKNNQLHRGFYATAAQRKTIREVRRPKLPRPIIAGDLDEDESGVCGYCEQKVSPTKTWIGCSSWMMTFPLCGLASSDHSHAMVELATRRDLLKEGRPKNTKKQLHRGFYATAAQRKTIREARRPKLPRPIIAGDLDEDESGVCGYSEQKVSPTKTWIGCSGSLLMKQWLKLAYHEGLMSTSSMNSQPEAKQQNRAKIPERSHI